MELQLAVEDFFSRNNLSLIPLVSEIPEAQDIKGTESGLITSLDCEAICAEREGRGPANSLKGGENTKELKKCHKKSSGINEAKLQVFLQIPNA